MSESPHQHSLELNRRACAHNYVFCYQGSIRDFINIPSLFNIDHDAPCLPPKFWITVIFSNCFFLGITVVPREIEDNGYAKILGEG